MKDTITDTYKGWNIVVTADNNMCSGFSFDITSPSGHCQHVTMGGDTRERAMERAKEMIDMEFAVAETE